MAQAAPAWERGHLGRFPSGRDARAPRDKAARLGKRAHYPKVSYVARFDAAMGGIDEETEPGNAVLHRCDLRLGMHAEPEGGQARDEGVLPAPQLAFAVAEQGYVVYVAQVSRAVQCTPDKVIERIEIAI